MSATNGPCGLNFSAADLQRLASAGHEIGCHSYEHRDAARLDVFTSLEDLAKNRDALVKMGLWVGAALAIGLGGLGPGLGIGFIGRGEGIAALATATIALSRGP